MAHEIDQSTGNPAVFVTGTPAWHQLGTVIDQAASSAEAIMLAGLDWEVQQWPIHAIHPEHPEQGSEAPDLVANVRIDNPRRSGSRGPSLPRVSESRGV